jgi:hypothetical protein
VSRREYQDNDNSLSQEPEVDCLALFLVPRVQLGKLEKRLVVGTFTKGSRSFSVQYYYYMVTSSYTLSCPSRQTMQSNISNYMRRIHAGYMPGDLYNLNSAYGTEDELKQCIAEMHNHNILVLGDVVLNHRCAQKQVMAAVWTAY